MMAADYRHIGGRENRLGRHYSRFSPFLPAPALASQSLALRKLCDAGSNRRRRAKRGAAFRVSMTRRPDFMFQNCTIARISTISDMSDHTKLATDGNPVVARLTWCRTYQLTAANKARITQ